MKRKDANEAAIAGLALLFLGIVVVEYMRRHPHCPNCGVALAVIKSLDNFYCPACGAALDVVQAALS